MELSINSCPNCLELMEACDGALCLFIFLPIYWDESETDNEKVTFLFLVFVLLPLLTRYNDSLESENLQQLDELVSTGAVIE